MVKTKKILFLMLIAVFMTSVMFFAINISNTYAQDVIRPLEPADEVVLETGFSGGKLQVSTTGGYTYQYWIKTKVVTDDVSETSQ